MMDKEAQEKILHEICLPCVHKWKIVPSGIAGSDVKTFERIPCEYEYEDTDKYCVLAHKAKVRILRIVNEQGYRKLPEDKPPLLSQGEIGKIEENWFNTPLDKRVDPEVLIAQAQREADIKFCAGD